MRRLSYEWLAGLRKIVIDPVRCPLAYEEFRMKEFERDRDGSWMDEIPDGNDHSIDAVRYTMIDDVLREAWDSSLPNAGTSMRVLDYMRRYLRRCAWNRPQKRSDFSRCGL